MSNLPTLELPQHNVKMPIAGKDVRFRPFTIGEENLFITALSSGSKANVATSFIELVQNCVSGGYDVASSCLPEFFYLVLMIRCKSKGEEVDIDVKCDNEECGKHFPTVVNVEKSIKWKNKEVTSTFVEVTDRIGLKIVPTKTEFLTQVETLDAESVSAVEWTICNSVESVMFDKQLYKDFSIDELRERIVSRLTQAQMEKVVEKLDELISLYLHMEAKCPFCGETTERDIRDIFDFFG